MKRSEALTLLSHEHHHALVISKRLQDAWKKGPEILIAYWQEVQAELELELLQHFEEEEAGFGDLLTGELQAQFLADHKQLRALLKTEKPEEIVQFAQQLRAHVRFEEREMFSWLESTYPEALNECLAQHPH